MYSIMNYMYIFFYWNIEKYLWENQPLACKKNYKRKITKLWRFHSLKIIFQFAYIRIIIKIEDRSIKQSGRLHRSCNNSRNYLCTVLQENSPESSSIFFFKQKSLKKKEFLVFHFTRRRDLLIKKIYNRHCVYTDVSSHVPY